jgi:hypothetical protein
MKKLLLLCALCLLLPSVAWAAPNGNDAVKLVRSFYVENFNIEKLPLSSRLDHLFQAASDNAKKTGGVVEGLDFDWISSSQDTEKGYQKTARFSLLSFSPSHATVRVTFTNYKARNDLRYSLITEHNRWKVDNIRGVGKDKWDLAEMLARGAKEK